MTDKSPPDVYSYVVRAGLVLELELLPAGDVDMLEADFQTIWEMPI